MEITEINSNSKGHPRYVVHWLSCEPEEGCDALRSRLTLTERYERVLREARKVGGKRFHCREYGGGVVFVSFNPQQDVLDRVEKIKAALTNGGI